MTMCFILNNAVINVGVWDYQEKMETANGAFTVLADGTLGYEQISTQVAGNPLPDGAVEADIPLAWTTDGRIVQASDLSAVLPFIQE